MSRARWLLLALCAALLVAAAMSIRNSIEWVDVDEARGAQGAAARDRFYVAKQLATRLGASVTTAPSLEQLPPPGAILVLGSRHWDLFPGRDAALRRWVEEGGHLVVLQSAWSADGEPPAWVPIRNRQTPRQNDEDDDIAAAAAAASQAQAADRARKDPRCPVVSEPDDSAGAYGAPRSYRVCGWALHRLIATRPDWLVVGSDGPIAARVAVGRGDVTADAIEASLDNHSLLRDDGALFLAALLRPRPGQAIWFFADESRTPFMTALWNGGAPALALAAAALALALWRAGTRFGPPIAATSIARRSIGEQVRRTAAFVAGDGGAALHRAAVRALEEAARRSIAQYASLVGTRDRADAIARRIGGDAQALAAAMAGSRPHERRPLAATIARLEHARRALDAGRHRPSSPSLPPSLSADTSPP